MTESGRIKRECVLDLGFVDLVNVMGDELTIVNAARVSFGKHKFEWDDKDEQLLKYLVEHRHTSPFEHVQFQFRIKCPLYIRSQWHRHRSWSYNEISRRYTGQDIHDFYIPGPFRSQSESNRQASVDRAPQNDREIREKYRTQVEKAIEVYEELLDSGVCREQARGVLPQALYTEFYATVDLHNLLHFIELRIDPGAQWEIQQYARVLLDLIQPYVPNTVKHFKRRCEKRGIRF